MAKQRWPIHRKAFIRRHNVRVAKRAAKRAEQATTNAGDRPMTHTEPTRPIQTMTNNDLLLASIARMEKVAKLAKDAEQFASGAAEEALCEIEDWTSQALILANRLRGKVGVS